MYLCNIYRNKEKLNIVNILEYKIEMIISTYYEDGLTYLLTPKLVRALNLFLRQQSGLGKNASVEAVTMIKKNTNLTLTQATQRGKKIEPLVQNSLCRTKVRTAWS